MSFSSNFISFLLLHSLCFLLLSFYHYIFLLFIHHPLCFFASFIVFIYSFIFHVTSCKILSLHSYWLFPFYCLSFSVTLLLLTSRSSPFFRLSLSFSLSFFFNSFILLLILISFCGYKVVCVTDLKQVAYRPNQKFFSWLL